MTTSLEFRKVADAAIDYLLETSPVRATQAGLHDYDGLLDSADAEFRMKRDAKLIEFVEQLEAVDINRLSRDDEFDREILIGNLRAEYTYDKIYRRWDRDPTLALEIALYGCLALIMRDFAPSKVRMESLVGRVKAIPRLLEEAKINLAREHEAPTVWAEMAEDLCKSAEGFLDSLVGDRGAIPAQTEELAAAALDGKTAISEYEAFLKTQLTNRSRGSYALGWDAFESLLSDQHGLTMSAEELVGFGESEIDDIKAEMARVAGEIDSARSVDEILKELKETAPSSNDLLSVYAGYVKSSENFLREKGLMTLPPDMELEVVETPEFVRHTYPFAAYSPPAPLDPSQKGMFWVTPVAADLTGEELAAALLKHNPYQSHLIALHEGFPGHHVQMTIAGRHASRTRKLFDSNVYLEGWALYCEELMWEQGYFTDPRYRLMQLNLELWRACRVVIDVKLHTSQMSFTEAVNLLVETAKFDKLSAIAEVKRYSQSPTQPLSYLVGKRQIMDLRADCRKAWGARFSLREFHDRLLALGSVPLSLARRALLEHL
ncbi:MAG: DUF885 domain-containing protein [Candidatus Zixiibacteriota bacterium]